MPVENNKLNVRCVNNNVAKKFMQNVLLWRNYLKRVFFQVKVLPFTKALLT